MNTPKMCQAFEKELMECVTLSQPPPPRLCEHLENCPACRGLWDDLSKVSALHTAVATHLPAFKGKYAGRLSLPDRPKKRNQPAPGFSWPSASLPWKVLAPAAAVVLLMLAFLEARRSDRPPEAIIAQPLGDRPTSEQLAHTATWQSLRQALFAESPGLAAASEGQLGPHYRLRDAYQEAN